MSKIIERLNKLSLPATILIASIILGGFYYASQVSKQNSIEKQHQIELQAKKDQEDAIKVQQAYESLYKSQCVSEAQQVAVSELKNSPRCTSAYPANECGEGRYLMERYNSAYSQCLQRSGLK